MFGKNRKPPKENYSDDEEIAKGKCETEGYESDELDDEYEIGNESDADVEEIKSRTPSLTPR